MDDLLLAVIGLISTILAALAGFSLGRRQAPFASAPDAPYEFESRAFAPRHDHKHEYMVMVADGKGWRCGIVTDGVECGRLRNG